MEVAVIGAGTSGLVSIKTCLEEGLHPTCFELTDKVGGIWNYVEGQCPPGRSALYKGLITNTSKEMTAYSDFPSPDEFPTYWTPEMAAKYYELYAEAFKLKDHIRFEHRVLKVVPKANEKWTVSVLNLKTNEESVHTFDAVIVCSGATSYSNTPSIPGQKKFQGVQIHSQEYRRPEAFENKTVVVVGFGNSGCDIATECSTRAKKVYFSTRRRGWIFPRILHGNKPTDSNVGRRWDTLLSSILPASWTADKIEAKVNRHWDHESIGLKPEHRITRQYPCLNDGLPMKLISGQVQLVGVISHLTENGVIINGEKNPIEADAIIYATGYKVKYPFLENLMDAESEITKIYKMVFPFDYPTLAFVGLINAAGPNAIVFEIQARWITRVLSKKLSLPSRKTMEAENKANFAQAEAQFGKAHHLRNYVDFGPYQDEIAALIGARPNLWALLVRDPALFWACLKGPLVGQQYRLTGPNPYPPARDMILNYERKRLSNMTGIV